MMEPASLHGLPGSRRSSAVDRSGTAHVEATQRSGAERRCPPAGSSTWLAPGSRCGLGPVHAVRAAAADATARFGKEAGEKLREQADALFAAASSKGLLVGSTSSPLPSEVLPAENVHRPEPQGDDVREKMEQAVVSAPHHGGIFPVIDGVLNYAQQSRFFVFVLVATHPQLPQQATQLEGKRIFRYFITFFTLC